MCAFLATEENVQELFRQHSRLPGNFEALAAAHVLAGHHVIFANHVGAKLGEAGTVPFIGASAQLPFFRANNPRDLVIRRLMAMRTI